MFITYKEWKRLNFNEDEIEQATFQRYAESILEDSQALAGYLLKDQSEILFEYGFICYSMIKYHSVTAPRNFIFRISNDGLGLIDDTRP